MAWPERGGHVHGVGGSQQQVLSERSYVWICGCLDLGLIDLNVWILALGAIGV